MSFFKKIQEKIIPVSTTESELIISTPPPNIKHEFVNFSGAYRIGILAYYDNNSTLETINNYKKELEKLGYECEVLLFVDKREKDNNVFLQYYNWDDLDKKYMLPYSPRTDRFLMKRFDLLFNLYFKPYPSLLHISKMSHAKCRVGPYIDALKPGMDLLIPYETGNNLEKLIEEINKILIIQKYERKNI